MEEIRFEPQGQRHRGRMPAPRPDRVVPARWQAAAKRGPQTGPTEVWFTILEFIQQARRATGLTSDEHLAEELLAALRYARIPSLRTVRIARAREPYAAGDVEAAAKLVSRRSRRRWREEKSRVDANVINAHPPQGKLTT